MDGYPPGVAAFSARALLDEVREGILVYDGDGAVVYANAAARRELGAGVDLAGSRLVDHLARLEALGARRVQGAPGEPRALLFAIPDGGADSVTLAERERRAIVEELERSGGRLAETARRLGISRTTLWRRLRAYGLRPSTGRR